MGILRKSCAVFLTLALASQSFAQEASLSLPPPILTIDQDRLFQETGLGARATSAVEAQAAQLASENSEIEQDLVRRELELTEQRASLPAQEFRLLADAFDQDVQRIRDEQDEKARALNRMRMSAILPEWLGIFSGRAERVSGYSPRVSARRGKQVVRRNRRCGDAEHRHRRQL